MTELAILRRRSLWAAAIVAFIVALGLARIARAEDSQDVRGTRHGCADVTATGGWDSLTSASLESTQSGSALPASLYWTEVLVINGSANVYLCLTTGASCGTGTGRKPRVASGGALSLPLRGLNTQSVAVYAANGTTLQVCGYFRTAP